MAFLSAIGLNNAKPDFSQGEVMFRSDVGFPIVHLRIYIKFLNTQSEIVLQGLSTRLI